MEIEIINFFIKKTADKTNLCLKYLLEYSKKINHIHIEDLRDEYNNLVEAISIFQINDEYIHTNLKKLAESIAKLNKISFT